MRKLIRQWPLYMAFFKSTLKISLAVAIGCSVIRIPITEGESLFSIFTSFVYFLPVGCILDILYKELTYKDFYYFYFNRGITSIELWIFSLLLYLSFGWILNKLELLWNMAWK